MSTEDENLARLGAFMNYTSRSVAVVSASLAFLAGVMGWWAFANLGPLGLVAFVLAGVFAWSQMSSKPNGWLAARVGFLHVAVWTFVTPFLFYMPGVLGGEGFEMVGNLIALLVWIIVFTIVAVVMAVFGWASGRKGRAALRSVEEEPHDLKGEAA